MLFGIAFLVGMVDVIAGGGGLPTIPALLFVGIPPLDALATNKVQSFFLLCMQFTRKGLYAVNPQTPLASFYPLTSHLKIGL